MEVVGWLLGGDKEASKLRDLVYFCNDDGDGLYVRGRSDHQGNQGRGSSRSKSKGKGTNKLKCYICYSEDHLKKDCLKRNKKKSTGFVKKNARQGSGMHYEGYDNGDLLMVFNGGTVFLGDNRACAIRGTGKVGVQMKDDSSFVLENVNYILELKRNLISLGTLDREGYTVKLQNGRVKTKSGEASVAIQENESLAQVWHKRLGHISEAGLHELEKREVIGNKGLGKFKFFKNYVLGKSTRVSFGRGQHTTKRVIDYVHADLWGPSRVESMSGCGYFLSIVDDYSRRFWVQFLRHKNEAFSKFKEWKCLLIQSGLPDLFWAEATVMTTYLINRSSSTALEKKTLLDLWLGHPTNYEMLRIFGIQIMKILGRKLSLRWNFKAVGSNQLWILILGKNPWNEDEEQDEGPQQQNLDNYVLVRDRAKRTTAIPARYRDEGNVSLSRPSGSRVEDDMDEWVRAMEEEMSSLKKNHTWEMVDQPPGQKLISCKVILSLTAYELEQLDVKTAFLHGSLQGSDDMLIDCKGKSEIEYTKGLMRKEFDMKELGLARKILGMEIFRDRGSRTLKVSQSGYVQKILNNYIVDNGKSVSVPLGAHFKVSLKDCSLMYLMVCTRPDIAYAVSVVRRYLANPGNNHWEAVKWILKYLKSTANVGLVYGRDQGKHVNVDGFVDADYAKDPNKGRSITGYVFMVHGCVVSWKETLQHVVAFSTTEVEYMALTKAVKEIIWLKGLLIELGVNLRLVVLNCDNQGAIHLSRSAMFHERTKHINVRYHFIREIVESKEIEVAKIGTKDNAADTFTKVQVRSSSIAWRYLVP
ncbi:retrovirus-related pol polyprotein from transposon TNT 1-94 [Tanacetum coccineum]